jgi:hypothetical protein
LKQYKKHTTKQRRNLLKNGSETIDREETVLIKYALIIRREDTRDAAGQNQGRTDF